MKSVDNVLVKLTNSKFSLNLIQNAGLIVYLITKNLIRIFINFTDKKIITLFLINYKKILSLFLYNNLN